MALALLAVPALAGTGGSIAVPEPTDLALFALGVIGLIVGRRFATRRD
ncbi:PEP-CTERM sorting domain-containing protein [Novosphingobium sp. ZN18A2]